MVELISRISKGSVMDQVYIPKKRNGFAIGSYVIMHPLEVQPESENKPFFYNIKYLEPVKVQLIKEIFKVIEENIKADNIIITGSFLDEGFKFNDIDIIIITEQNIGSIKNKLKNEAGINSHLIEINNKSLIKGMSTDPLYQAMLSRCVSKKRIIQKINPEIDYKLLDLHLLKSKLLIETFDFLTGTEKYEMLRNAIAINIFIEKKKVTKEGIDAAINNLFGDKTVKKLKDNLIPKKPFIDKYKKIYISVQNTILKGIKNGPKQKQAD